MLGQDYGFVHDGLSLGFLETARRDLLIQGSLIASAELILSFLMMFAVGYWLTRHLAYQSALILFNIDRFKNLNDAQGHKIGDDLLIAVGARLASLLRESDTLARVAADEFAILLLAPDAQTEIASRRPLTVAEKIHAALHQPLVSEKKKRSLLPAWL